jgi:hypothetical protein
MRRESVYIPDLETALFCQIMIDVFEMFPAHSSRKLGVNESRRVEASICTILCNDVVPSENNSGMPSSDTLKEDIVTVKHGTGGERVSIFTTKSSSALCWRRLFGIPRRRLVGCHCAQTLRQLACLLDNRTVD